MIDIPMRFQGQARRIVLAISAAAIAAISYVFRNPTVMYTFHGATLAIPMSHALPRIILRHPDYSANIGRIVKAIHSKYSDLAMIDIGANIGDTIAIIRESCHIPALCIDGERTFVNLLNVNASQWKDVEIECAFIGTESRTIQARISSKHGTGHLSKDAEHDIEIYALSDVLALHPRFSTARLLKIDTDGFDTLIIKGAVKFLKEVRPIIYLEYDPYFFQEHDHDGFKIFELLYVYGYSEALFFWNTGEFYTKANLADTDTLRSLHMKCAGLSGSRYFDVCIFHKTDVDISMAVRAAELALADVK